MYDELVKRLRDISNSDSNIKSNYIGLTMLQAANAIEELQRQIDGISLTTMPSVGPRHGSERGSDVRRSRLL